MIGRDIVGVQDFDVGEQRSKFGDAVFDDGLFLLGDIEFAVVFGELSVVHAFAQTFRNLDPLDLGEVIEFFFEPRVSPRCEDDWAR